MATTRTAAWLGLLVMATVVAQADTIYVSSGTPTPRDGVSWASAYGTIGRALNNVAPGDEIRVAQGTFVTAVTLEVPDGVTIRGGYAGFGTADPDARDIVLYATAISGDVNGDDEPNQVNREDNPGVLFHVNATTLGNEFDGLRLSGAAQGGGAIQAVAQDDSATLVLRDLVLIDNRRAVTLNEINVEIYDTTIEGNGPNLAPGIRYLDSLGSGRRAARLERCHVRDNKVRATGLGVVTLADRRTMEAVFVETDFLGNTGGYAYVGGGQFERCVFERNKVGGALVNASNPFTDSADFIECTFRDNGTGADSGQGAFVGCLFERNRPGGAIAGTGEILVQDCVFRENRNDMSGGAVRLVDGFVIDSLFEQNRTGRWGGALFTRGDVYVLNSRFFGNQADAFVGPDGGGGAIYSFGQPGITCVNSVFVGNRTSRQSPDATGGAMVALHSLEVVNCTIVRNTASDFAGGIYSRADAPRVRITNSIVWGNRADRGTLEQQQISLTDIGRVRHSCVEGFQDLAGFGSFSASPRLVDPDGADNVLGTSDDDVRIGFGSPCIDAGLQADVLRDRTDMDADGDVDEPTPLDLDGLPRFDDDPNVADSGVGEPPLVDLGAYENPRQALVLSAEHLICEEGGPAVLFVAPARELSATTTMTITKVSGDSDLAASAMTVTLDQKSHVAPVEVVFRAASDGDWWNGEAVFSLETEGGLQATVRVIEADSDSLPARVYVRNGENGAGTDWGSAFGELRDALAAMRTRPGTREVWVASGTYTPTAEADRDASFRLPSDVTLRGGFAGYELSLLERDASAPPTVLSGDLGGDDTEIVDSRAENSYTVVTCGSAVENAVLDQMTVRGGNSDYPSGDGGSPAGYRAAGGGIYASGRLDLVNCRVVDNRAGRAAGAQLNTGLCTVTNSIIAGNYATQDVGGLEAADGVTIANSVVAGNITDGQTGGLLADNATVANTILWGNRDSTGSGEAAQLNGMITTAHCLIENWVSGEGFGNFDSDPRFVDPEGADGILGTPDDNWRLAPDSPAIDAGANQQLPFDRADLDGDGNTHESLGLDLDGNARVADALGTPDSGCGSNGVVDLGPYEAPGRPVGVCAIDLTDDQRVDLSDLAALLAAYGSAPGDTIWNCLADRNSDGRIDSDDLALLLAQFGAGCN